MRYGLIVVLGLMTSACTTPEPVVMQAETLSAVPTVEPVVPDSQPIPDARNKALKNYQLLLELEPNDTARPEIIRRIADLTLELGESVPLPDETNEVAKIEYRQAVDKHYSEAAGFYERLLAEYPESDTAPGVYYQLAKTYEQQGSSDDILATLNSLAENYPNLEGLDEVHFRRAELMFSAEDLSGAALAYQQVIDFGESSSYYERALYKRGWTLFKQSRFDEGVEEFIALFDLTLPGLDEGYFEMQAKNRTDRELLGDALRAVSLSMSYLDGPSSIPEYFKGGNARLYEDLIYGSLAAHYLEKERYADSATAELEFVRQHPQSRQAPIFQHRAINAYARADFPEKVLEEKRNYILLYEERNAQWNIQDVELIGEVRTHLENYIVELAQYSHALGQEEKNPAKQQELLAQAVSYYGRYLTHFPANEQTPGMHFLMAEALFESRRYREATIEYEQAAYKYKLHDKAAESGYAAMISYDKHQELLPPLPERKTIVAAKVENELGYLQTESVRWKLASVQSAQFFFDQFPDHPNAVAVMTRAANELYALVELEQTIEVATQVVELNPPAESTLRFSAWSVIAHSEFELSNFARAESAYSQVLRFLADNDERRAGVTELLAVSIYRQGEEARAIGQTDTAVGHFMRVGEAVPDSPIRATAEYDAAAVLLDSEQWVPAIAILKQFRTRFPESELQPEVTRNLAVAYLNSDQKLAAAGEFNRLGTQSDNPQFRREAGLQAAELYEESGALAQAAQAYARYISQYPDPLDEATELRQKMADLSNELGDKKVANEWLNQLVQVEERGGNARTPRTRYLAANAVLILAEPVMAAYQNATLSIPLKESLARKKVHMTTALDMYSDAAAYGVQEVSTAATYHTGEIYRSLSEALLDSERPAGLSELELEQYEILLEDEAFPFEEQAIEVFEINIARLPQGVFDEWVKRSLQALAKILPARYNKTEVADPYVAELTP
ncbi:MAG: tetratricopeptide repeat protein [Pseudomonadota bacterium]